MRGRMGVVLDMVAIVQKQRLVQPAVVAGGPAGVFKMPLEKTEAQAEQVAGNINREKEFWRDNEEDNPQRQHQAGFTDQVPGPFQAPAHVCMMCQVPVAPEPLRNAEEKTLAGGEETVPGPLLEEGQMNKVVGDGVAVPPEAKSDQHNRRPVQQNHSMHEREQHQKRIPM